MAKPPVGNGAIQSITHNSSMTQNRQSFGLRSLTTEVHHYLLHSSSLWLEIKRNKSDLKNNKIKKKEPCGLIFALWNWAGRRRLYNWKKKKIPWVVAVVVGVSHWRWTWNSVDARRANARRRGWRIVPSDRGLVPPADLDTDRPTAHERSASAGWAECVPKKASRPTLP